MGFFSFVGDIVSGIGRAFSGVASAIGEFVVSAGKAVGKILPVLGQWAGHIGTAVQIISLAIDIVSRIMHLIKDHETVPDLGERVLQAEEQGITLDTCGNDFDAYMEQLRKLKLDPQKAAARQDKPDQWMAGCLLLEKGLSIKFPHMATAAMWPILARNPEFFTKERLETYANLARERDIPFGESVAKYFIPEQNKRLDPAIRDYLFDAEKKVTPTATRNDICEAFDKVEAACAHAQRQATQA